MPRVVPNKMEPATLNVALAISRHCMDTTHNTCIWTTTVLNVRKDSYTFGGPRSDRAKFLCQSHRTIFHEIIKFS